MKRLLGFMATLAVCCLLGSTCLADASPTATLSGTANWSSLTFDPAVSDISAEAVVVDVTANSTLSFDQDVTFANITFNLSSGVTLTLATNAAVTVKTTGSIVAQHADGASGAKLALDFAPSSGTMEVVGMTLVVNQSCDLCAIDVQQNGTILFAEGAKLSLYEDLTIADGKTLTVNPTPGYFVAGSSQTVISSEEEALPVGTYATRNGCTVTVSDSTNLVLACTEVLGGAYNAAVGANSLSTAAKWEYGIMSTGGDVTFNVSGASTVTADEDASYGTVSIAGSGSIAFADGTGTMTATGYNVAEGTTLIFDPGAGVTQTVAAVISGAGAVQVASGAVIFDAANTFTGGLTINSGALAKPTNATGLGAKQSTITVVAGGTLDVNGNNGMNYNAVIAGTGVDGTGAIINSGASVKYEANTAHIRSLTLTDDATVGCENNWGIGAEQYGPKLLNLNGHTLTVQGAGQLNIEGINLNGGSSDGTLVIADGAKAETFNGNTTDDKFNITVQEGGTFRVHGNLPVKNLTVAGTLNQTGGTIDCKGTLAVTGALNINGGETKTYSAISGDAEAIAIGENGTFTWYKTSWSSPDLFTGSGTLHICCGTSASGSAGGNWNNVICSCASSFAGTLKASTVGGSSYIVFNARFANRPVFNAATGTIYFGMDLPVETPFTVKNLTGAGNFYAAYNPVVLKYIDTLQTEDTVFSGTFTKDSNGSNVRDIGLIVRGSDGAVHSLTVSGANTSRSALTVQDNAKLILTGSWAGDVVVADGGYFQAATIASNVEFKDGGAFVVPVSGTTATSVSLDNAKLPASGTVKISLGEGAELTGSEMLATYTTTPDCDFAWAGDVDPAVVATWALVKGSDGVTLGSSVATFNGNSYTTLSGAFAAASAAGGGTVTLTVATGDAETDLTIPAGVVLNVGANVLTCNTLTVYGEVDTTAAAAIVPTALAGTGVVAYTGVLPSAAMQTLLKNGNWQGTLWLRAYAGNVQMVVNDCGNAGSVVRLTDCGGWFNTSPSGLAIVPAVELVDGEAGYAMQIRNANSHTTGAGSRWTVFDKVLGDGTFAFGNLDAAVSTGLRPLYVFKDATNYTGSINLPLINNDGPMFAYSATEKHPVAVAADDKTAGAKVYVYDDGYAKIGDGKSWALGNGVELAGTLALDGAATITGAVTFVDGAALVFDDLSDGKKLTLDSVPTIASGARINVTLPDGFTPSAGTQIIAWPEAVAKPAGKFRLTNCPGWKLVKTATGVELQESSGFIFFAR